MNYVTIVFVNGSVLTRRLQDLHSLSSFTNRIGAMTPSGRETIVNWDNVAYVREAEDYEIKSCDLHETIKEVV